MTQSDFSKMLRAINSKSDLIGKKVKIERSRKSKHNTNSGEKYKKTIGLIGVIKYIGSTEFGIEIEGLHNPSSSKGYFYYSHLEFNFIDEREEKEMSEVKGNYEVALVQFLQGTNTTKEYAFALFDTSVGVDDFVLCDSANGYGVAKVTKMISKSEYDGCIVTREIICKVDFTDFNNRIEARNRRKSIKKQMDKMVSENQELVLYQMLAEKSPEMAKMLEEYKQLMTV